MMTLNKEFKEDYETDRFGTGNGSVEITYLGHGTLYLATESLNIHIDPVSDYADYSLADEADIILITHHHGDHLDPEAIKKITGVKTRIILSEEASRQFGKGEVMRNGNRLTIDEITINAVPAYNTTPGHEKFHPRGRDNGYILTIDETRIYIAGDTEFIPEMDDLDGMDIAFLPMNQPYTMQPYQVAQATKIINPGVVIPYHYGETDTEELIRLLEDWPGEVRIRNLA